MWRETVDGLQAVAIAAIVFGAITWLIRSLIDYRRWLRLVKVQTEVHSKLLDRFTGHDDLLAYVQSPAGSKFLQSSPIALDAGMRSMGAPLGRILWSVQAGVVLTAAGIGLQFVSREVSDEASQMLHAMGVLGVALGLGFVIAAAVAYLLSQKLGLIATAARADTQG
jgi:Na+/proline symporter